MEIIRREVVWIHTHFVTDCTYLPDHYAREITRSMDRLLERERIVFGIHYSGERSAPPRRQQDAAVSVLRETSYHGGEGLLIVLECVPLPETMNRIEQGLGEIISSIPARPRTTAVQVEAPKRGAVVARR